MRRAALLVPVLATALGGTPAGALPIPCRAAAVDPLGDTYGGNAPEPNADLTAVGFARAWGELQVEVRVAHVDGEPLGTILGRDFRVTFTAGGTRFVARWQEATETFADLSRAGVAAPHTPAGEPGSLAPLRWGEIGWEVVPARDAVVLHVPLEALEAHGVAIGPDTKVTDVAAATYGVADWDRENAVLVPVDDMAPSADGAYRLGEPSCR